MGIRLPGVLVKQILRQFSTSTNNVPKGSLAVYIGQTEKKRFVVLVYYLNQPSFMDLLRKSKEEFGFDHPMDGLTIPCKEDTFLSTISRLRRS